MAWFLNLALTNWRNAINAKYPKRDKASDGTIGDPDHRSGISDHNEDRDGSVDAFDQDVEVNGPGKPYAKDIELLKATFQAHPASQYWIHAGQIATRDSGWKRVKYNGKNRHDKHVHWNTRPSHEKSNAPWIIGGNVASMLNDPAHGAAVVGRIHALVSMQDPAVLKLPAGVRNEPNELAKAVRKIQVDLASLTQMVRELTVALDAKSPPPPQE